MNHKKYAPRPEAQGITSKKMKKVIRNPKRDTKPRIHVYTGEGEGKTTNAFGLALRAIGHGQRVIIIQFLKGRKDIGEYLVKKKLGRDYEIYQFGRKEFIDLKKPTKKDTMLAKKGFEFAKKVAMKKPDLLILDEICLAAAFNIIKVGDIIKFIKNAPKKTTIIMTGRRAPKQLIKTADLATEMKFIKHPYQKGEYAKEGIEY